MHEASSVKRIGLEVSPPAVVRSRETGGLIHVKNDCQGTVRDCSGGIYVCVKCFDTFQADDIQFAP